jgi:hypothetical protein
VDYLNSYDDGNWYLNVTSLASDDSDEGEGDYVTPGCPPDPVLRDCGGGATNAIYYDVNRPITNEGYTFIDYCSSTATTTKMTCTSPVTTMKRISRA